MLKDAFKKLDPKDALEIVRKLNEESCAPILNPDLCVVLSQNLDFYGSAHLLDIQDYSTHPSRKIYAVHHAPIKENNTSHCFTFLDWTNSPIYKLNKKLPVTLSKTSILGYVRFFFHFVSGEHGQFIIVENLEEVPWREEQPQEAKRSLSRFVEPLHEKEIPQGFEVKACMIFKDSLFSCLIDIDRNGFVNVREEQFLVEDIPVMEDILKT